MKKLFLQLVGPLFAAVGVFGLAGSGILWNFMGRSLGLPSTGISILALLFGVVLLRPLAPASASVPLPTQSSAIPVPDDSEIEASVVSAKQPLTTAESIAQELAESQKSMDAVPQVNFAPEMLLPGQGLQSRKRRPGASLKCYKSMAGELFDTK